MVVSCYSHATQLGYSFWKDKPGYLDLNTRKQVTRDAQQFLLHVDSGSQCIFDLFSQVEQAMVDYAWKGAGRRERAQCNGAIWKVLDGSKGFPLLRNAGVNIEESCESDQRDGTN